MNPILRTEAPLSVDEAMRLDKVCDRFETAWRSGTRPRMEDFLEDQPESARSALLYELLQLELSYRRQAEEHPSLDEYQPRFPQEAELLAEVFEAAPALTTPTELPQPIPFFHPIVDRPKSGLYLSPRGSLVLAPSPGKAAGDLTEVAGHELLGVLGQGGMGVVYQARHRKLNRLVALKMVRPDSHAGCEALSRFRTEAEAVARLQHPNIVQIYEVGEHDGLPYFSMEFVEGGSLAQHLDRQPQPARPSAELVEVLARAMHSAHEGKIVHRDLKPHNVLMTQDGTPKITDFGLAKLLDQDAGQTQSGQPVGTPAYMAPEQAAGRLEQIGPATDVYALGVILYEMLTGRPPFCGNAAGNDAVIIMAQVIDETPVSPGCLAPAMPCDLETICLKCLKKEPHKRYASALSLAEDLRRFLNGEPIQARPTPTWERAWKWGRRRPALVTAAGVLIVAVLVGLGGHFVALRAALDQALAGEREANDRVALERILMTAEKALVQSDWDTAQGQAKSAQTQAGDDARFIDLRTRADQILVQVDQRMSDQDRCTRFGQHRDDAQYYTTLLAGVDKASRLKQTIDAAERALALYDVKPDNTTVPIMNRLSLSNSQKRELMAGCYELLLIWADAVAQLDDANPRTSAKRALVLMERAAQFGFDTPIYHSRREGYLSQLGGHPADMARPREMAKQSSQPGVVDFFLRGIDACREGKTEKAIREFKIALGLQPDHFGAQYALAVCHLKSRSSNPDLDRAHLMTATGNLSGCISRRPNRIWPHLLRGHAHGELDEFEAAEADFLSAERLNPDEDARYGLHVNRAVMRIRKKDLDKATDDLQVAIQLRPDSHQAHAWLARVFQEQSKYDDAVAELNNAIALKPPILASLYRDRARLQLRLNKPAAALHDLDQVIQLESARKSSLLLADDHYERARLFYQAKQYADAVQALDTALRHRPDFSDAHRLRGEALIQQKRDGDAVKALAFALSVRKNKSLAQGFQTRGQAYTRLGKHMEAAADYARALDLEPDDVELLTARGWAYSMLDANKLAYRDFENVVELQPDKADGYNGRGYALAKLGDYLKAVADAEQALKLGPIIDSTCYNAARIFAQVVDRVDKDTRLPPAERIDRRKKYQDQAVELLRRTHDLQAPEKRKAFWQDVLYSDLALLPIHTSTGYLDLTKKYPRPKK